MTKRNKMNSSVFYFVFLMLCVCVCGTECLWIDVKERMMNICENGAAIILFEYYYVYL